MYTRACVVPLICKKKSEERERERKEEPTATGEGQDGETRERGMEKRGAAESTRWQWREAPGSPFSAGVQRLTSP